MAVDLETDPPAVDQPDRPPASNRSDGDGWRRDSIGREYIPAKGRSGVIYRDGEETVPQALERDAKGPRDKPPKRAKKPPPKKPPPANVDLREIEKTLAEAFSSPAMLCATFGDEWGANHFTNQAPYLARNLVRAAEHNPWLRAKLEAASTGGDAAMKLITMLGVGGALFGYAVPPIVYWFNLPVPDDARRMFGIPPRKIDAPRVPPQSPQPA